MAKSKKAAKAKAKPVEREAPQTDYRDNARANRLLAAVDSLLGKEKAFGTPTGWERWMNELREARACWPWP